MMDRETVRNMQEFYSKNKLEKLVHLVGFIVRIKSADLKSEGESFVCIQSFE